MDPFLVGVGVVVSVVLVSLCTVRVRMGETVVIVKSGEAKATLTKPGLHFCMPGGGAHSVPLSEETIKVPATTVRDMNGDAAMVGVEVVFRFVDPVKAALGITEAPAKAGPDYGKGLSHYSGGWRADGRNYVGPDMARAFIETHAMGVMRLETENWSAGDEGPSMDEHRDDAGAAMQKELVSRIADTGAEIVSFRITTVL